MSTASQPPILGAAEKFTSRRQPVFNLIKSLLDDSALDSAIETLLAITLAFGPLSFGAVEPWSAQILAMLVGAMLLCMAAKALLQPQTIRSSNTYIPIVCFLAIATLQLISLPNFTVHLLSPATASLRPNLLSDAPTTVRGWTTLSLYPHATRHELATVIIATGIFFIVSNTISQPNRIRRLLIIINVIGGLIATIAMLQDLTAAKQIYWIGPLRPGIANAGPFILYNNFGQFMNLSTGAAFGLLLVELRNAFRRSGFKPAALLDEWREPRLRPIWILSGLVIVNSCALLYSGSRGAIIGMAVAFVFAVLALSRVRALPGRGWLIVPIVMAIVGCLPFVGISAISDRFARLNEQGQGYTDRLQILRDLTVVYRRFPLIGTGLGTHEVIYPGFDRSTNFMAAVHAEDDLAQLMEEMGVLGLTAVVAFIVLIARSFIRAARSAEPPVRLAAIGLGVGLVAVITQSFTDFGQHLPGIACLSATFCGLIVSLSRLSRMKSNAAPDSATTWLRARLPNVWRMGAMATALGLILWACVNINHERMSHLHQDQASDRMTAFQSQGTPITVKQYNSLILELATAVALDSDNVVPRYFLGLLEWQRIEATRRVSGKAELNSLQLIATRQVVAQLLDTRMTCPTFSPVYLLAAQLEAGVLHDNVSAGILFKDAFTLANADSEACFDAAATDARAQRWDLSQREFARYLELSNSFGNVLEIYVTELNRPDLALPLAKGDRARLESLADVLARTGRFSDLAAALHSEAAELLKQESIGPNASLDSLRAMAQLANEQHDYTTATECYRRALEKDYGQIELHLGLARVLAAAGHNHDAMHEARICLRMDPHLADARKMVSDLSVLPGNDSD